MKLLILLLLLISCRDGSNVNGNVGLNEYEVVRVGAYCCVGMDGLESGGVWCERTNEECKL